MTTARPTATLTGDALKFVAGEWVVLIPEGTVVDVLARPISGDTETVIAHGPIHARVHPYLVGDTAFTYPWENQ